jgi:hypothetical protein
MPYNRSCDSSVGRATGYGLDDPGSIADTTRYFLFSASRPTLVPTVSYTIGTEDSFRDVKRLGREPDHSPPPSAEVKKVRAIPLLPNTSSWHGAYVVKHRDNFTLPSPTINLKFTCTYSLLVLFGAPPDREQPTTDHVADLVDRIHDIHEYARKHLKLASGRMKIVKQ